MKPREFYGRDDERQCHVNGYYKCDVDPIIDAANALAEFVADISDTLSDDHLRDFRRLLAEYDAAKGEK